MKLEATDTIARHWIDDEWVESDTVSESINPATGEVLGRWEDGGETEARAGMAAARRAFDTSPWSRERSLRNIRPSSRLAQAVKVTRSVAYFHDAEIAQETLVLGLWAAAAAATVTPRALLLLNPRTASGGSTPTVN